ncbi:zf-U1-domain-containing protein, partial [Rhodotorula sp. JG-1b]
MGKYYCDYCDVFLTHDSSSVRRAHNSGRNHLSNVRDYYANLGSDRAQELIDQITRRYENGGGGQARILQLGPGGLPMSMGSNATFVPPPSGGAPPRFRPPPGGGMPPPFLPAGAATMSAGPTGAPPSMQSGMAPPGMMNASPPPPGAPQQ